ncbi:MAG TPA: small-conductance mechanosensitive ion channel [Chloroflexota bacterium]|nr:small-conductance mechanosensitive ion channel [Chloroflexota bacterium]
MTPVVTNDWGTALMTSVAGALALFLAAVPRLIGIVLILLVGWLIAGALAAVVAGLLRSVRFNELAQRAGLSGFVHNMGVQTDAAGFLAGVAKWFVRLIVLVVAFDALGLPAVSQVLQQFLLWLPNLVVALVVLVIAGLAANALAGLVRGATAEAGIADPDMLATVARVGVWAFGIVVAVNQLGVATTLVNTLVMGLVGALALALGLAFGLGGRETAAEIVRSWYGGGRAAAPEAARAVEAAREHVRPVAEAMPSAAEPQERWQDPTRGRRTA